MFGTQSVSHPLSGRRSDPIPLLLGTLLFWTLLVLVFAFIAWFDNSVRGDRPANYLHYLAPWAKGMLPWLVVIPFTFRFAARFRHRNFLTALLASIGLAMLVLVLFAAYVSILFSIGTPLSAWQVFLTFKLSAWLRIVTLVVAIFMAGLHHQNRQPDPLETTGTAPAKPGSIAVKSLDRVEYIPVSEILGATAQGNYIALLLGDRDVLHRASLSSLSRTLLGAGFVQIHRSHLVNPEKVTSVAMRGGRIKQVQLPNGASLPVSARHSDSVRLRLADRVQA